MKTLFIPAKAEGKVNLDKKIMQKLPKKIGLAAAIQYLDQLNSVKKQITDAGKKAFVGKGEQLPGQVLGCDVSSAEAIKKKVDCFLYIGSGEFHPIGIALKTGMPVFVFNPIADRFGKVSKEEISRLKKKRKANLMKFYSSDEIGIIVSTKPGQMKMEEAKKLKKKIEQGKYGKGKSAYVFIADNINPVELENFNFIQCWVNTACPRIEGKGIINSEDLQ